MKKVRSAFVLCALLVPLVQADHGAMGIQAVQAAESYTPGQKTNKTFKGFAVEFLENYCIDCHDDATKKGNLSLENLGPVNDINEGVWRSVWAQVALKEMPPKKKSQPPVVERLLFSDWIVEQMSRLMAKEGGFQAPKDPAKANYVDHSLLFGPLPKSIRLTPTATPARLWRVTPQEHITRLNELVNIEPKYDPARPGLRAHGDFIPTDHAGELKIYFGTDNIKREPRQPVDYLSAIRSAPVVFSSARAHGLENYPNFYSVNSAESTRIYGKAAQIIRYMAYGPASLIDAKQNKVGGKNQMHIAYHTDRFKRPKTPVYELMKASGVSDVKLRASVNYLFEALTFRPPNRQESEDYLKVVKASITKLGKEKGAVLGLAAIFLDRDALFRSEMALAGQSDRYGRVMLQDWELGLAVNHALKYIRPDAELKKSITSGHMRSKGDVKREIERMLADDTIRKPRLLQFFRDYFDYDLGGYICKDEKRLKATGANTVESTHYVAMFEATASTDRLIELILKEDKDVFRQLLTTDKIIASDHIDLYYGWQGNSKKQASAAAAKESERQRKALIKQLEKEVAALMANQKGKRKDKSLNNQLKEKKNILSAAKKGSLLNHRHNRGLKSLGVKPAFLPGSPINARVSRRSFGNRSLKPRRILASAPKGQRMGILTHPSWLVSHTDAMDNHAIHRGKWVLERLLGGAVPDVPITVDAMLPDEPKATLRHRMRVTREKYCWTCHKKMDPLGLPFEMYNHAGLYRTVEQGKPVDATGEIIDSGDPKLDGKVSNAIEMIEKLANSERAEQVFVRHAFRFWIGRNETLNDRPVLQDAYRAYKQSGGSMKALLVSLLTSDAFLYRKRHTEQLASGY